MIDFIAKLWQVPAKEAAHLLACAYGIQPYNQAVTIENQSREIQPEKRKSNMPESREVVRRAEFTKLEGKVERLTTLVWSLMFENGNQIERFDDLETSETFVVQQ